MSRNLFITDYSKFDTHFFTVTFVYSFIFMCGLFDVITNTWSYFHVHTGIRNIFTEKK